VVDGPVIQADDSYDEDAILARLMAAQQLTAQRSRDDVIRQRQVRWVGVTLRARLGDAKSSLVTPPSARRVVPYATSIEAFSHLDHTPQLEELQKEREGEAKAEADQNAAEEAELRRRYENEAAKVKSMLARAEERARSLARPDDDDDDDDDGRTTLRRCAAVLRLCSMLAGRRCWLRRVALLPFPSS
jgi:hypothetical protein